MQIIPNKQSLQTLMNDALHDIASRSILCSVMNAIFTSMYFFMPDFYGKNNLEKAYIDQILDTIQDLAIAATPYILEKHENKAKKVNLIQNMRL